MSMTIWLNVRTGDSHESDGQDLSALFALQEQLDNIAGSLAVQPVSNFFDDTDLRYNMEEEEFEESEEGWLASAATWHEAGEVLQTIGVLLTHLDKNPAVIKKADGWTQTDVIEDLQALIPGVEAAVSAKKQVHLLIVM